MLKECIYALIILNITEMSRPYHHVRFRWWSTVDLEKTTKEMENSFKVIKIDYPEPTFYKDDKKEVIIKADTLTASLSLYRAVLSQEKVSPFTIKDMTLREKIFELYPQNRPTPFPFLFSPEPKFEKQ